MAFVAPIAGFLAAASPYLALAGTAVSAYQTYAAGQARNAETKAQAQAAEIQARGEEIDRKKALLRSLASQNAMAGGGGITTGGSFAAIQKNDIRNASNDLAQINAERANKVRQLRAAGRSYQTAGSVGAVGDAFSGAIDFGRTYAPKAA